MNLIFWFVCSFIYFVPLLHATETPPTHVKSESDTYLLEAQNILEVIKNENKHGGGFISVSLGVMQIATPQAEDPIKLNSQSIIPVLGLEADFRLIDEFGAYFKFTHAQNMLFPPDTSSPNSSSSYQQMIEATTRYKFILDQTQIKSYVNVKLGAYLMSNNFELYTTDPTQRPNAYLKSMTGLLLGVERSIPATPQFDFKGALDLIYVIDSRSDTTVLFDKQGTGFQFKGEIYYNFSLFGTAARWGGGYGLGVFFNRINDATTATNTNRSSLVQNYRIMSTILNVMF